MLTMKRKQALKLLDLPLDELIAEANRVRKEQYGSDLDVCGVINAKSGACPEDCKFCAQSSFSGSGRPMYPLISKEEILLSAKKAKANGAERFGIVTSGNRLSVPELEVIADTISEFEKIGIKPCASLGSLGYGGLKILKEAGLTRYHHNIETSERFYPEIVSTHDHFERIRTICSAKTAGLEVCSGGILGMGETWEDRIDMAIALRDMGVVSVPLNFLVPIKGTPMEKVNEISPADAIRSIAIFRIVLGKASIKIVAGRETVLKDFQAMIYLAGANGMMIGGYLTIEGRSIDEDKSLLEEVRKLWDI